jgi:hypothetical protein
MNKCGACTKFHTIDCVAESPELVGKGLYFRDKNNEAYDDSCFEPKGNVLTLKTSCVINSSMIAEQCYDANENKVCFAVKYFNKDSINFLD